MTEQGITLVETLLAVVILFFLTSTIIPFTHNMKQQISAQKIQAHAAEAAYIGALKYSRYSETSGVQQIDGIAYHWIFTGSSICVSFNNAGEQEERCI